MRQGDPLSPYLFIIALETLAIRLRSSKDINGITINNKEFKLSLFADDFCSFCRDTQSINNLFDVLEQFHTCSSLKFNQEKKTEILSVRHPTSSTRNEPLENVLNHKVRIVDTIKIPGNFVGRNANQLQNEKLAEMINGLKKTLNLWKSRNLTLFGKIQILKTFGISKCTYLFSSIQFNSSLFSFPT